MKGNKNTYLDYHYHVDLCMVKWRYKYTKIDCVVSKNNYMGHSSCKKSDPTLQINNMGAWSSINMDPRIK